VNEAGTLNVAMLGTKFMGRAHAHAWRTAGRFFDLPAEPVLAVVAGRDAEATRAFAEHWGWERATTRWRTAATDPEVDLVDVATPNDVHADQAIAALEAGKHVACEKPLAGTLDDARAMRDAARKAQGDTFVWYSYRRVPAVALAHQLVQSGWVGRIYHVRAAYLQGWGGPETPLLWRFRKGVAGSGSLGDLNAHIVDMARFITGEEIVEVSGAIVETFIKQRPLVDDPGRTGRSTVDDAVLFLARLEGGAAASFESTRLATGVKNSNRIEIHGERGALRFNFERMNELEVFSVDDPPHLQGWRTIQVTHEDHPWTGSWWPDGHGLGYEHTFVNQAADMVAALGGDTPVVPLPDFADAYETQRVLQAALVSARERSAIRLSQIR
jgi:predicted dehydrogenase